MKAIPLVTEKQSEISLFKLLGILSAVVGGIVEEVFFRRWIMDHFMTGGYNPILQVVISGVAFGLAHTSWTLLAKRDFKVTLPAILSTSILGIFLAIIYLAGGRNLGPCIFAHVLINIVIEPWLMLSAVSGEWRTYHRRIAAPLLAGIPEFSSGKEQVFPVKLIKESKMSQKIKEIPMPKRFFPGLLPIIGDEKYKRVVAKYQDLFEKHEHPIHPALQWHLIEGILPGLAFYQILREGGETQESALAMIDKAFEVLFSDNFAKMKTLGRLSFVYPFLRKFIKPAMRQYPPEGWKIDWLQNDKNAIRFNMKSCFYFDTFSKYGAPELTASFCRVDDLTYDNMSPRIKWQRSKTIARGEAYCDFCFLPVKEQQKG